MSLHPLLFAAYPVLHLLATNSASARPRAAIMPLAAAVLGAAILWLGAGLLLRDRRKGALLATAATAAFFAHGHAASLVGGGNATGWLLVAVGGGALAWLGRALRRTRRDLAAWHRSLDTAGALLVALAAFPIARTELDPPTYVHAEAGPAALAEAPLGYLPDIYVIILDAFGRADRLQEIYDVDLRPLHDHLRARGFMVAERADANYCQTSLSLAALLNADFVQNLLPPEKRAFRNRKDLNELVRSNRVVRDLRARGYRLVTLAGGSELAVQADPDVTYTGGVLNEFQSTLLSTTPLPLLAALAGGGATEALDPFAQHRAGVKFQLAKLPHASAEGGPKLVFAHVLSPHPPFVVDADGNDRTPDYEFNVGERYAWNGYVDAYAGQVTWLARELAATVDAVLEASRRPPVILITGDHGPASRWIARWRETGSFEDVDRAIVEERMPIFLALLMPEGPGNHIYREITPVNVFPLVFERCFGEKAQLRPDHSWFSTYDRWSVFTNVDAITDGRVAH